MISFLRAQIHLFQPWDHAEDAYILSQNPKGRFFQNFIHLLQIGRFFIPVSETPFVDSLAGKIGNTGRHKRDKSQNRLKRGEKQEIEKESKQIFQQIRQSVPDCLRSLTVA